MRFQELDFIFFGNNATDIASRKICMSINAKVSYCPGGSHKTRKVFCEVYFKHNILGGLSVPV